MEANQLYEKAWHGLRVQLLTHTYIYVGATFCIIKSLTLTLTLTPTALIHAVHTV